MTDADRGLPISSRMAAVSGGVRDEDGPEATNAAPNEWKCLIRTTRRSP